MKKTILLIEDEIELQQNLKEILEFNKFEVNIAENSNQAFQILNTKNFDLIISDIMMPHMDGIAFLKELKKNKNHDNVPFIFLTAKVSSEDIRKGMDSGADDYLTKPVSGQMLLNSVFNNLAKKEQRETWVKNKLKKVIIENKKIKFHELRTPIFGINSTFELLEEMIDNFDREEFLDIIQLGKHNTERLNSSIEYLNMFNNLENLEVKIEQEKLSREFIIQIAKQKNLEISIKKWDKDSEFIIDEKLFHFVINEILTNTSKFGKDKFKPTVKLSNKKLVFRNTQQIFLNQINIKPKPFTQFKRKRQEQQGFGIGLYLVNKIVKSHGYKLKTRVNSDLLFETIISTK